MPGNLHELDRCFKTKQCIVFQSDNNPDGHSTTDTAAWFEYSFANATVGVVPVQCFKSTRYEPYVVIRKDEHAPHYDENFEGYGKNKIQYIQHLRYMGFRFSILPAEFIIHYPHPRSTSKKEWLEKRHVHSKVEGHYNNFRSRIQEEHGTKNLAVRLCKYEKGKKRKKGLPLST